MRYLHRRLLAARVSVSLLTSGCRPHERHDTPRATINWSYELLSQPEQRLFAVLGVFIGGCRLEAAEAICGGFDDLDIDVLDDLTSLIDKSLVRQRVDPHGGCVTGCWKRCASLPWNNSRTRKRFAFDTLSGIAT